jgi:hypothetical protein
MHIGVVAEGPSDLLLLEALILALLPDAHITPIQPDVTLSAHRGAGWRGVQAWCEEFGSSLATFMRAVVGDELDRLVIHCDCSMSQNVGARRDCPPARDTADALRAVLLGSWLGLGAQPDWLVFATPSECSDTWIVAALVPPYAPGEIECISAEATENVLVARGHLRAKEGKVQKAAGRYVPLVEQLITQLATVRERCTEAERFCIELPAAGTL